jgi:hypothetical protein
LIVKLNPGIDDSPWPRMRTRPITGSVRLRVPAAALDAYLRRLESEQSTEPMARDLRRESIRVEVESRLAGFKQRTGTDPAKFSERWQAGDIPDTAENAELAMDALALRNVMEYTFEVA